MAQAKYMTSDSFLKRHRESISALMATAVIFGLCYYGYDTGRNVGHMEEKMNPEHKNLKRYETYIIDGQKYFLDREDGRYVMRKDK